MPDLSDKDMRELGLNIGWRLKFKRAFSTLTQDNQDHTVQQQDNLKNHDLPYIPQVDQVIPENNLQHTNPYQDYPAQNQNQDNSQNNLKSFKFVFFSTTLTTGNVLYSFLDQFYRFGKREIKPCGRSSLSVPSPAVQQRHKNSRPLCTFRFKLWILKIF